MRAHFLGNADSSIFAHHRIGSRPHLGGKYRCNLFNEVLLFVPDAGPVLHRIHLELHPLVSSFGHRCDLDIYDDQADRQLDN